MALIDDINALPTTVGDGNTGHLNNHQVIHAALKDHESRLGVRTYNGIGAPSIAAPVGSTYIDTAVTAGAVTWIKTSGTGISGWNVQHGDTGLRNIASLMSDTTSDTFDITVRRIGGLVQVACYVRRADKKSTSITDVLMTLPTGFRPQSRMRFRGERPDTIDVMADGQVISRSEVAEGLYLSFSAHFITNNPWPTTLPGTPA